MTPEQALAAAARARQAGDRPGEEAMLVAATAGGDLAQVAGVELAELVLEDAPRRAASTLLPVLFAPRSRELQGCAVDLLARAVTADPAALSEAELRRVCAALPRPAARRLELAAAGHDPEHRRHWYDRLLRESTDDLVALAAAEGLAGPGTLDGSGRWLSARAYFRHGRYLEALDLLAGLTGTGVAGVRAWELHFITGRACFRLGRWGDAVARYEDAAAAADTAERRAMLEVHRSRALELGGNLDEAVDAARLAVATRGTDARRLHLLRLRLRQGRLDLATEGQRRLRGGNARAEGALRLALHELAAGRVENAGRHLEALQSRPWGAPAAVIRARLAADRGEWAAAAAVLDRSVDLLDPYWGAAARRVMGSLPAEARAEWRRRWRQRLEVSEGEARRRTVERWAVLECEPGALDELRREAAAQDPLGARGEGPPAFTSPLATRLWSLGLRHEVGRFDPGAFPNRSAAEAAQSGRALLELGRTRQAIRLAESAVLKAFPRLPARVLPTEVRTLLYPLPWPEAVEEAAAATGVDAPLLAGLVREESRWEATALSAVGARGLTQIMPATAVAASSRLGWPAPEPGSLFDPRVALHLGAAELARLLVAFDGHRAAAVAGYNAGEAQARLWLGACGAGCSEERLVAGVTFAATRGYVAHVLASAEEYRELHPGLGTPEGP